jgi:tetratricopeptide (TPR) repeat protein
LRAPLLCSLLAWLLCTAPDLARATGADAAAVPPVEPAPCLAAIAASDDDKIIAACAALIDNEKTAKADRIKALIARAAAFARKDQLDPTLADTFNDRGELWWKKGDRPKALADFAAAIKLNPDHPAAKGNYKRLAKELERLGALMAVYGKPSFSCATARKAVEKAICADPELANLDREINAVSTAGVRSVTTDSPSAGKALQHEQDEFLARRDAEFGKLGYDLQKAMRERLQQLLDNQRR